MPDNTVVPSGGVVGLIQGNTDKGGDGDNFQTLLMT